MTHFALSISSASLFPFLFSFLPMHFLLNMQIHICIHVHGFQFFLLHSKFDQLLHLRGVELALEMALILCENLGFGLLASETVAQWRIDEDFFEGGAVVQD